MYNAIDSEAAAADVLADYEACIAAALERLAASSRPENEFSKRARGRLMGLASATYYDEPEIQAH